MRLLNRSTENQPQLNLIASFLVLGIVGITLLSLISSFGWNVVLELFSHFKVQYFILSILLFCWLLLLSRKKAFILVSIFCLSILLAEIVPWHISQTRLSGNNPANFRVLSSNVNTKNHSYSKVLSLLEQEQPDVAVFMEIDQAWAKQLDSLKDIFPYSIVNANLYNLGIAVYSKHKLENGSIEFFGVPKNPSIVGNLTINGRVVSLIATHPPPPKPNLFQARNKQLDEISQYIKSLSNPVVMVGDFNITMWSRYYKRFVSKTGLRNARKGFGILPTWPVKTNYPPYSKIPSPLTWLLSVPIDHCLASPDIKVVNIRTGSYVGSDHRPLIADLVIPEKG